MFFCLMMQTLERIHRRNIGWSFCGDLFGIWHILCLFFSFGMDLKSDFLKEY